MIVSVDNIEITDLDRAGINADWDLNKDDPDMDRHQRLYFNHRGHRVYIRRIRTDIDDDANLEATNEVMFALRDIEPQVNQAIINAGATTALPRWNFTLHAGCGMCPCSPGFLVDGDRDSEKAVRIDITVRGDVSQ